MIALKLDSTGSQQVRWPETASDILRLARKYTTWQAALPANAQIKDVPLATVQALLTQVEAAVASAMTGETSRATAAETLRQRLAQARPLVDRILMRLKLAHEDNLAQLEAWGLFTVQTTRGVTVRKPKTLYQYHAFLSVYIAKESSLPAGQQITDPPLATIQALFEDMDAAINNRAIGSDQRELGMEQRNDAHSELLYWLKTAAIILVAQNGGTISTALQQHGFTVAERASTSGTNGQSNPPAGSPTSGVSGS